MKELNIEGAKMNASNNQNKRLDYFDIAKGIGILLVIAGHFGIEKIDKFVFIFHMPLFFIISGYFINPNKNTKEFIKKRAKSLLIPYIITSLLIILGVMFKDILKGNFDLAFMEGLQTFVKALYGSGSNSNHTLFNIEQIGAIWFLEALFISSVICKLICENKYRWIIVIVLFGLSYISSLYIWLPFNIQSGLCSLLFVMVGYEIKKIKLMDRIGKPGGIVTYNFYHDYYY